MMEVHLSKVDVSDIQVTGNAERVRCRGVLKPVKQNTRAAGQYPADCRAMRGELSYFSREEECLLR